MICQSCGRQVHWCSVGGRRSRQLYENSGFVFVRFGNGNHLKQQQAMAPHQCNPAKPKNALERAAIVARDPAARAAFAFIAQRLDALATPSTPTDSTGREER